MRSDIEDSSKAFLQRVKEAFVGILYSKGEVGNVLFIPRKDIQNCLGVIEQKAKWLAAFVGIEFIEYDPEKETKESEAQDEETQEAEGQNEEIQETGEPEEQKEESQETIVPQKDNQEPKVKCDPRWEEGYILSIPDHVEGEEKTSAQKMWEEMIKEYQEQVKKDETEAEQLCKKVLEKLDVKDYRIEVIYAWNEIRITVKVEYDRKSSQRHAWKEKIKAIMSENGFNPDTYIMHYETTAWRISYKMTE